MPTYQIDLEGDTLKIGFGIPGTNCEIVRDAEARLAELKEAGVLKGGRLLKITGAASMPVAFVLAHGVGHLYGAIAVYDPKLGTYVIVITHDPAHKLGGLVD